MSDALNRAGFGAADEVDGLETHDCFTVTEYMAIDHSGLTKPGESWKAVEAGRIALDGDFPINASGGLIGLGHPVGATGVRMALIVRSKFLEEQVRTRYLMRKIY